MIGAELIAELDESSYNLNTSPYTVSNLQGDLYDYHFIAFCDSGSATDGHLDITLNSDTGTNYSRFYMRGSVSTASASTATSQTAVRATSFTRNASSRNSLLKGVLTGSSGDNRKISFSHSSGNSPQVYMNDMYWTNTADEATSMTFTGSVSASYKWHIMVYRVPKESVQGSWEYMKELSWSSESAEKSFTVDGDTDIQYRLTREIDQILNVECNNDNGSNYVRQRIYNNSGTLSTTNSTETSMGAYGVSEYIINAKSGVDRLIYTSDSNNSATDNLRRVSWWQNTADNLTSIDCTPTSSATGTCKLYRKINPNTTSDPLPFETIKVFDVSGDYSAGDTLSGLTCDDYKMVKIEWLGKNTSGNTQLEFQFNADTGNNYSRQALYGDTSTVGAVSQTSIDNLFISFPQNGDQSHGVVYIYPRSGEYRPSLHTMSYDENALEFHGGWWLNSADEITSIKCFANNTNSMSGQIKISVLRDHNFGAMTASSLLLNGTSQYTNAGNTASLQTTGNTSAFIWVNSTNDPTSNETFFSKYNTTGNDRSWQIEVRGSVGNAIRVTLSSDGSAQQPIDATTSLVAGTWYHIGFVYNGSTIKIYVNGVEENSVSYSSGIHNSSTADVIVGCLNQGGANLFDGSTQLASLFNTAITQTDIDELYNGGVPKQPWLLSQSLKDDAVLLLPLNSETDSNEYSDYSGNANDATATGSPTISGEDITIISGPDPSP